MKPILLWKSIVNYGVIPKRLNSLNYKNIFKFSSSNDSNLDSYLILLSSGLESYGKYVRSSEKYIDFAHNALINE